MNRSERTRLANIKAAKRSALVKQSPVRSPGFFKRIAKWLGII